MNEKYQQLVDKLRVVSDLGSIQAVLSWDQATYMPPGGAAARGRQMAVLGQLSHQKATDPEIGQLLEDLQPYIADLPDDSDEARLVQVAQRTYERTTKIPNELIGKLIANGAAAYDAWTTARPENDFKRMIPLLETTLELSREVANCFPHDHVADPLIDNADYGMSAESTRKLFAKLRAELVPLVQTVTAQEPADDSFLKRSFPIDTQKALGEKIIRQYGYDFNRGRQDLTHHPFMTKFSLGDVRITTRFDEHEFGDGLFSTLHEAGHAMYEQGINMAYEGTPLANGTSAGVHESQSRLWENLVGRSRPFWEHYYPHVQEQFADALGDISLDQFYRGINKVSRSLIRVDADELTYNLHVMLRFDLELEMLEGNLAIRDLPDAWHARYKSDLGMRAPNDSDGVLQDVHWYSGIIGGVFQGYTLGNIMSAAFFDQAVAAHPEINSEIGQGKFDTLHGWLRDNIYKYGSKYTAAELVQRVTGDDLSIEPYMRYLRGKFGELYEL